MAQQIKSGWVITDGRRGISNQALGLAEACAEVRSFEFTSYTLKSSTFFSKLPPFLQTAFKGSLSDYNLGSGQPDIIIGCGRQAIAPLLVARRKHPQVRTVYIQDPRVQTSEFTLVVAPKHDKLSGNNIISIIGSPNRVTLKRLQDAKKDMPIKPTSGRRLAAWLVGGNSKTHKLTQSIMDDHEALAKSLIDEGYDLFVTTSRRTPSFAVQRYASLAENYPEIRLYDASAKADGPNPYFPLLAQADIILATEDSTNMLTESCATGRPVYRLKMDGRPGKFQILYDELEHRCHVQRFEGQTIKPLTYKPLMETQRAAEEIWKRFDSLEA